MLRACLTRTLLSCSQTLTVLDDVDFYDKQLVMPLSDVAAVSSFLSALLYRIVWVEFSPGTSLLSKPSRERKAMFG
jgi:hypothetical protein